MTAIFDAYETAGIQQVTFIVPKSGAPTHQARRAWFSDVAARRARWPRYIYVDVWNELADPANDPDSAGVPGINPLYSEDGTHLNALGRVLGLTLAALIPSDFADVVPNLSSPLLPSFITASAGGTIVNNSTATVTGTLLDGLTLTIPTTFTGDIVEITRGTSGGLPELVFHVMGRTEDAYPSSGRTVNLNLEATYITDAATLNLLAPGDVPGTYAEVAVDPGSKGVGSICTYHRFVGNGSTAREWRNRALTPGLQIRDGWAACQVGLCAVRSTSALRRPDPLDATIRVKDFKLVKATPEAHQLIWV